jgi:hypothetical protein
VMYQSVAALPGNADIYLVNQARLLPPRVIIAPAIIGAGEVLSCRCMEHLPALPIQRSQQVQVTEILFQVIPGLIEESALLEPGEIEEACQVISVIALIRPESV